MNRAYGISSAVSNLGLSRNRVQEAYFEVIQTLAEWSSSDVTHGEALEKLSSFGVTAGGDIGEDLLLLALALRYAGRGEA